MQFDCGTRILRVISRAGRPGHFSKLHQYPAERSLDVISHSQLTSQTLKYLFLDSKAGRQLNPEGRLV